MLFPALRTALFLAAVSCFGSSPLVSQTQPQSQPGGATPATDLHRRVEKLESEQQSTVEALKAAVDSLRTIGDSTKGLMIAFGTLLTIIVGVQTYTTLSNLHQERGVRRQEQQQFESNRERRDKWDSENTAGLGKLNSVLQVIHDTMKGRLDAEIAARRDAEQLRVTIGSLQNDIASMRNELKNYTENLADSRVTIENEHQLLEQEARELAQTQRHDFRDRVEELSAYVPKYDSFIGKYHHKLEQGELRISAEAQYVRGVAAHYGSKPVSAHDLLKPLVTVRPGDSNERRCSVEGKRSAIALYFLGLIESNFANYEEAIKYFDDSISLEPDESGDSASAEPHFKDILSRVVRAEACAMSAEPGRTTVYFEDIRSCLRDAIAKCERRNMPFPKYLLGLDGRAKLVEVNMLLRKAGNKTKANEIPGDVLSKKDPSYFALVTYAQLLMDADPNNKEAHKYFAEAYAKIRNLNHLIEVTELRSRILVRIVAGMSARYSDGFEDAWEAHLDSAIAQLNRLPKRGTVACTVFSPFSKRNEASGEIKAQISAFREDNVWLSV